MSFYCVISLIYRFGSYLICLPWFLFYSLKFLSFGEFAFIHNTLISSNQSNPIINFRNVSKDFFPLVSKRSSAGSEMPVILKKDTPAQLFIKPVLTAVLCQDVARRLGFL